MKIKFEKLVRELPSLVRKIEPKEGIIFQTIFNENTNLFHVTLRGYRLFFSVKTDSLDTAAELIMSYFFNWIETESKRQDQILTKVKFESRQVHATIESVLREIRNYTTD